MLRYSYIIILFILGSIHADAQLDSLPSDELQIINEFDVQIQDADKVDILAPIPEVDTVRPVSSYNVTPKFLTLTYDAPEIQPLMMKPGALPTYNNGFVRMAMGYPIAPYVEGGYQLQQDNLVLGGKARYRGAFDWNQLEHQQYTDVDTDINAEYQFDSGFAVGGNVGYDYDQRFFYGYDHDSLSFEADDVKQYFSLFKAGLDFKNTTKTYADINYALNTDFYTLSDNYTAKELGVKAGVEASKYFGGKHEFKIGVVNDFIKNTTERNITQNLLSILPSFTFSHHKFKVKAGVNASLLESGFELFPDANVLVNLYKNQVSTYLGWKGHAENNTFRTISENNPYVASNPTLTQKSSHYPHLGFNFDFPSFDINIEGGYRMVQNQPFFVNDRFGDEKRFQVVYDNVDYITTSIDANARPFSDFEVGLGLDFQSPNNDRLSTNYHDVPNYRVKANVVYSRLLNKKLSLGTSVYYGSSISFLNNMGLDDEIKPYVDVNLMADYKLSERSHVFLSANNLANQKYQRWNGYPNFGINGMLGFFWAFK